MDEPILAPKGVSKTEFGYRVQLNVPNPNKTNTPTATATAEVAAKNRKFSRNAKTFAEALWLYEIAILISDSHYSLNDMIEGGNYRSLYSMKVMCVYIIYNWNSVYIYIYTHLHRYVRLVKIIMKY